MFSNYLGILLLPSLLLTMFLWAVCSLFFNRALCLKSRPSSIPVSSQESIEYRSVLFCTRKRKKASDHPPDLFQHRPVVKSRDLSARTYDGAKHFSTQMGVVSHPYGMFSKMPDWYSWTSLNNIMIITI